MCEVHVYKMPKCVSVYLFVSIRYIDVNILTLPYHCECVCVCVYPSNVCDSDRVYQECV